MRASPSFQLCTRRFGVWRAMVFALWVCALGVLIAWSLSSGNPLHWTWRAGVLALGVAAVFSAAVAARSMPVSLRWDTQAWHLGPVQTRGEEPWRGRLAVALDFGVWMLLRFDADTGVPAPRTAWIPVQRSGLEAEWHALRCAVYCARPAQGHAGVPAWRSDQNDNNERP